MEIMNTAYCPICRAVANLSVSITLQTVVGLDGKEEIVVSKTHHCASCLSFVCSEEGAMIGEEYVV